MSESDNFQEYTLTCLRLAAELSELGARAHTPSLREHFLGMARMWTERADQHPIGKHRQ
jgi:hypothetical protein